MHAVFRKEMLMRVEISRVSLKRKISRMVNENDIATISAAIHKR